jgi:hypothetical protein
MRCGVALRSLALTSILLAAALPLSAQQAPDNFRWVDFHSPKDQDVVVWVTRSLAVQDWTAIREIAVEYDAALVVTSNRATPQSAPNADTFSVWSVSLTNHIVEPLISGANLRWLDWMRFADSAPEELAAVYDNCRDCAANTYFTAFYYDVTQHRWTARWIRGGRGAPLWSANTPPGVEWTQVYAGIAEPNGREFIATWSHFDYDNKKPSNDVVFRYDLDPFSHLERSLQLVGKDADAMELRLCRGQDAVPDLQRGQDSPLCLQLIKPIPERKPVTTPPANNHGQSAPPRAHH